MRKNGFGNRTWQKCAYYKKRPLLADIKDRAGKVVGYCVVELLPGVYNKNNPFAAFARTG